MPVNTVFASHTPLKDFCAPSGDAASAVDACLASVREEVAAFDPELVVVIGPDHFNGFFYRLMPSFCVGMAAESVGDWNTPAGALPVDASLAEDATKSLHAAGIDVAVSYRMEVDHGITQLLDQLFAFDALPAILPLFINCAAPPRPPLDRVVALGDALGQWLGRRRERVLLLASGGLSHDPPIPELAKAPAEVRERLIAGGVLSAEARAVRQQRVLDSADQQVAGTSDRVPLNPAWDQQFLERLAAFDFAAITTMTDDAISADGGCGGHEIRTWIAAAAAARGAGIAGFEQRFYRAIPEWIAGYAIMTGQDAARAA